jgi:hypothetical protein
MSRPPRFAWSITGFLAALDAALQETLVDLMRRHNRILDRLDAVEKRLSIKTPKRRRKAK